MKIELGGGITPIGEGFVNVDHLPTADVVLDLEQCKLPFEDDSVDEVYTAHTLEHIRNAHGVMVELLRVCKVGARITIKVPHYLHEMAMCGDHKHVISERQVRYWCEFSARDFPNSKKWPVTDKIHYQPDVDFHELRSKFPQLTDAQVLKHIPNCCHEVHFHLHVVERY